MGTSHKNHPKASVRVTGQPTFGACTPNCDFVVEIQVDQVGNSALVARSSSPDHTPPTAVSAPPKTAKMENDRGEIVDLYAVPMLIFVFLFLQRGEMLTTGILV